MKTPIELFKINRTHISDADGTALATVAENGTAQAAASEIVRRVNMHDGIVKALRRAVETLDALNGELESRYIDEHLLLLKAEGRQP
jgi:hypothetical protein